jgi:hypothetical protein
MDIVKDTYQEKDSEIDLEVSMARLSWQDLNIQKSN